MDFFGTGIPLGRYFGINVRLHVLFLVFAAIQVMQSGDPLLGGVVLTGLYFCILLHEFGHALAARWCDGEAEDILLWPFGGVAFCRPAWHPTAHLITAVAGPLVTLVIAGLLYAVIHPFRHVEDAPFLLVVLRHLAFINLFLLLFNLVPAFPMDGGRILRDTLWHFMPAETATRIAVWTSRLVAGLTVVFVFAPREVWLDLYKTGVPLWLVVVPLYCHGNFWLLAMAALNFFQGANEQRIVAAEAAATYQFSVRERLQRGRRQRAFRSSVSAQREQAASIGFHRCAVCGKTENDDPHLDFRVCTDCRDDSEYCAEHLDQHTHR
jgi:Zn-dependent protease